MSGALAEIGDLKEIACFILKMSTEHELGSYHCRQVSALVTDNYTSLASLSSLERNL